jgi:beta-glucanase (GH16 family)
MKILIRLLLSSALLVVAVALGVGVWARASAVPASSTDPSGQSMPGVIAGWTQTFADDFTSPASLNNYYVYAGGPGDGSDSCWATSHAVVTGGELVLKGFKDPAAVAANNCATDTNEWVTGGVKLQTSQLYGKYEVRERVDNGQGVSAVSLLWPTSNTAPPEIDFMEDNGAATRTDETASEHWGTPTIDNRLTDTLTLDLSQWHTVGVEWSPGKLVYTMDGVPWATETNANVSNVPMQLALQTEAWQCGTSAWEECASSSTPAEVDMDVDWIAVYAPAN